MNKYEFVPGDEITIAPGRTHLEYRLLIEVAVSRLTMKGKPL